MIDVKEPSLARQFVQSGLACIVWQMSDDDLEELKSVSPRHHSLAKQELSSAYKQT